MNYIEEIFNLLKDNRIKEAIQIYKNNLELIENNHNKVFIEKDILIYASKILSNHKTEKKFWYTIIFKLDDACLSDELIAYLINNDIAISPLAHCDLADKWLFQLGTIHIEAYQTLIVRYFTKGNIYYKTKNATPDEFEVILNKIGNNEYLIDWIVGYLKPDNPLKLEILYYYIINNNFNNNIKIKAEKYYLKNKS